MRFTCKTSGLMVVWWSLPGLKLSCSLCLVSLVLSFSDQLATTKSYQSKWAVNLIYAGRHRFVHFSLTIRHCAVTVTHGCIIGTVFATQCRAYSLDFEMLTEGRGFSSFRVCFYILQPTSITNGDLQDFMTFMNLQRLFLCLLSTLVTFGQTVTSLSPVYLHCAVGVFCCSLWVKESSRSSSRFSQATNS